MSYEPNLTIDLDEGFNYDEVIEFLQDQHSTLWGQTFTVQEDDRALAAAVWWRQWNLRFAEWKLEKDDKEAEQLEALQPSHPELYGVKSSALNNEFTPIQNTNAAAKAHDEEIAIMLTGAVWGPPDPNTQRVGPPTMLDYNENFYQNMATR